MNAIDRSKIPQDLRSNLPDPETPWMISTSVFDRIQKQPWVMHDTGRPLYQRCELIPEDVEWAFLLYYFKHQKPSGFDIANVYCIHNPALTKAFEARIDTVDSKTTFTSQWKEEDNQPAREAVIERWKSQVNQFYPISIQRSKRKDTYCNIRVLPLWHGTSPGVCHSIASAGFTYFGKHHFFNPEAKAGSFKNTDPGYFGSGMYFTNSSAYAAKYNQALMLSWVGMREPFPVINDVPHPQKGKDMKNLEGREHYQSYNAHYIPVAPKNGNPSCMEYYPLYGNQKAVCDEIVVFDEALILPRFWVELIYNFPKTLFAHPLVPGSFAIETGALPVSAGLSVLAKCSKNTCTETNQLQWVSLGMGSFNLPKVYCTTVCPSCKINFETIDHFLLHNTTYSLEGGRTDGSLIEVKDQALSPDQSLMISHFSEWKYLEINLK